MYVMAVAELNLDITAVVTLQDFNRQYRGKIEQLFAALAKQHVRMTFRSNARPGIAACIGRSWASPTTSKQI